MQTQGCCGLKIKYQSYFDAARTRVKKKRILKCPCAGAYLPQVVESIAVDRSARQTEQKRLDVKVTQTSMLKAAQVNGQLHPIFVIKHVPVFTAEWLDSLYRR